MSKKITIYQADDNITNDKFEIIVRSLLKYFNFEVNNNYSQSGYFNFKKAISDLSKYVNYTTSSPIYTRPNKDFLETKNHCLHKNLPDIVIMDVYWVTDSGEEKYSGGLELVDILMDRGLSNHQILLFSNYSDELMTELDKTKWERTNFNTISKNKVDSSLEICLNQALKHAVTNRIFENDVLQCDTVLKNINKKNLTFIKNFKFKNEYKLNYFLQVLKKAGNEEEIINSILTRKIHSNTPIVLSRSNQFTKDFWARFQLLENNEINNILNYLAFNMLFEAYLLVRNGGLSFEESLRTSLTTGFFITDNFIITIKSFIKEPNPLKNVSFCKKFINIIIIRRLVLGWNEIIPETDFFKTECILRKNILNPIILLISLPVNSDVNGIKKKIIGVNIGLDNSTGVLNTSVPKISASEKNWIRDCQFINLDKLSSAFDDVNKYLLENRFFEARSLSHLKHIQKTELDINEKKEVDLQLCLNELIPDYLVNEYNKNTYNSETILSKIVSTIF